MQEITLAQTLQTQVLLTDVPLTKTFARAALLTLSTPLVFVKKSLK